MYTARYNDGQTAYVQTALRFGAVVFDAAHDARGWGAVYRKAAGALLSAPGVDFACRFALAGSRLERALFITGEAARAEQVHALAGGFLRLNALAEESVEPCLDLSRHDELTGSFPAFRRRVRNAACRYNDCQLVTDFRLAPLLEPLFVAALQRGWDVAFQFNVRRYRPTAEDARSLRKNLLRVECERLIPHPLVDLQRRVAARTDVSSFLIDQFVGFGGAHAADSLSEMIAERFGEEFGRLGFDGSPFEDSEGGFEEQLATGFHSSLFEEPAPVEKAADAASPAEVERLLRWQPDESWAGRVLSNARTVGEDERDYLKRIERKLGELEHALRERNVAATECAEMKKALDISRADPPFALVKTRQILEGIILRVYVERKRVKQGKPLFNMIDELLEDGRAFPRRIASYLHTIRVLGNLEAHVGLTKSESDAPSESDVEITLLMTLNLVEWYLREYSPL